MSNPLKVATLNANGIRSAIKKGLIEWLAQQQPDVVLFQEVRAEPMPAPLAEIGYETVWFAAQKAGYSGVAIASKFPLQDVQYGINQAEMDSEGRVISAITEGVRFVSVYLPSGSSREERQAFKERMLPEYQNWVDELRKDGVPLVLGGDYNVAHQNIDIKNWRANLNHPGFLPHEREWMTQHLASGLSDNHRLTLGEEPEYTWWSQRTNAFATNSGWRIDYLLSSGITLKNVRVDRSVRLSNHAPLVGILDR